MGKIKNSQQKKLYSIVGVLFTVFFVAISLLNININMVYAYGGGGIAWDYIAPTISNINGTVSATTATITWITNESSISWVVYGTTTAYGLETKTETYITSHSLHLTNLTPSTTYHYSVKAKDNYGNIGFYTDQTFTTLVEGEVEVPFIQTSVSQMTFEELKAEIAKIVALITKLQAQFGIESFNLDGCIITSFDRNLMKGSIGNDVKCLQMILNLFADTKVAITGPGSSGNETNYFGILTKAAVIKFQEKYKAEILDPWGFTNGTRFVGTTTRPKLNTFLGK